MAALLEAFLGPGVLSALAFKGTFALHAAAVSSDDLAVGLLGPSEAGKWTLAQELARLAKGGWERVAAVVLPVSRSSGAGSSPGRTIRS